MSSIDDYAAYEDALWFQARQEVDERINRQFWERVRQQEEKLMTSESTPRPTGVGVKLEVGKFYRTRDGRKARVICTEIQSRQGYEALALLQVPKLPQLKEVRFYYFDGRSTEDSVYDLIAEWTEPIKKEFVAWMGIGEVPTRDDSICAVDRAFGAVCSTLCCERREGLDYWPTVKKFKVTMEEMADE